MWTIDKPDKVKEVNCSPSEQNSVSSTNSEEKPRLKSLESSSDGMCPEVTLLPILDFLIGKILKNFPRI